MPDLLISSKSTSRIKIDGNQLTEIFKLSIVSSDGLPGGRTEGLQT